MSAVPANGVAVTDEYTRGYRAWMLFILLLMNVLNLADRQGLAAIAPAFKRDLGLTDTELKEAITHLAFYAGWPRAMSAIAVAKTVLDN